MKTVFLVLFFCFAAVHLVASFFDKKSVRYATKAFILLFLLLYYLFSAKEKSGLMIAALVGSLIGDIFFMPPGLVFFAVGGAGFLVSQVCFILRYAQLTDFSAVNYPLVAVCFAVYFVAAFLVFKKLKNGSDAKTLFGMIAYLAFNGAMNLFAFMLLLSRLSFGSVLVFFGAASFYVSDILLFFNDFYKRPLRRKYFLVMLTYIIAEFCITQGVLMIG